MDLTTAPQLVLDEKTDRGFVNWFKALPKDPSVVRFFDRKDFYSVYGDNALYIATTFYKTSAVVKYIGGPEGVGIPGVAVNRNLYETILRDLLIERAEHTVQLFEGSGSQWRKTKEASPGKLAAFDEELFHNSEMAEVPLVMAVTLGTVEGHRMVGMAFCDMARRHLGACEFADDEHFCSLETLVIQLGAKEIVLPKEGEGSGGTDARRVRDVVSRCAALATERPKSLFLTKYLEQDLARLLRSGNVEQHRDVPGTSLAAPPLQRCWSFSE
eukprot:jgi/Botrbrau1/5337/Bobra.0346s0011.1